MKYLNVKEVAERYAISQNTVWRWAKQKRLPNPIKVGPNCTRWPADQLDKFDAEYQATTAGGAQ